MDRQQEAAMVPRIVEYKGKRVLTTAQLAECYGTSRNTITKNFQRNKGKYKEGVHYLYLEGDEKRAFLNRCQIVTGSQNAKGYISGAKGACFSMRNPLTRIRHGKCMSAWLTITFRGGSRRRHR